MWGGGGGGGVGGGNIHAFSGGLSANECKYLNERDHKIYTASQSMGRRVICFFLLGKWSLGHILTKEAQWGTPGTPRKSGFSDRKRPKEGERVARRHFHERVGESPRREKNFGTSGYKIRRFVSEIWPFEVGICVRAHFTMQNLGSVKGP